MKYAIRCRAFSTLPWGYLSYDPGFEYELTEMEWEKNIEKATLVNRARAEELVKVHPAYQMIDENELLIRQVMRS